MAPNPRRQDERLTALYATLPAIDCQGLCSDSCGPIEMSVRERDRIERAAGRKVTCGAGASCSMLTADRRCGQYELRPLICRMWGVVESLPCPYGCVPEGGRLPDEDGYRLLVAADEIGGAVNREDLRRRVEGLRALADLPPETRRRMVRDVAATIARPSLAGRRGALPKSIIEL